MECDDSAELKEGTKLRERRCLECEMSNGLDFYDFPLEKH